MAQPIEMPFWELIHVAPRNHVLDGGSRSPLEGALLKVMCTAGLLQSTCHRLVGLPSAYGGKRMHFTAMAKWLLAKLHY